MEKLSIYQVVGIHQVYLSLQASELSSYLGIYHGVSKRDLPLFVNEQVYRYNQEKYWKEHVEQDCQVSMFLITYSKKGNHSVTGSGYDIFYSIISQMVTHKSLNVSKHISWSLSALKKSGRAKRGRKSTHKTKNA